MKGTQWTLGAAVVCAFGVAGAAQAAPVTYDIDQALWGQCLISSGCLDSLAWQAGKETDVATNPSAYHYVRGQVTVDWDAALPDITALNLTMEMLYPSGKQTIAFDLGDEVFGTGSVSPGGLSTWSEMETTAGPDIGSPAMPQFTAKMNFQVTRDTTTEELFLQINGMSGGEYEETLIFLPYGGFLNTWSYNRFVGGQPIGNPTTRTYGGAGITAAGQAPAVPLPAAGWMLLAGLGGLAAMRRRAA